MGFYVTFSFSYVFVILLESFCFCEMGQHCCFSFVHICIVQVKWFIGFFLVSFLVYYLFLLVLFSRHYMLHASSFFWGGEEIGD